MTNWRNPKSLEGLKLVLMAFVIVFLAKSCLLQPIPTRSRYLGQAPPGDKPKVFPLSVKPGCFAAERIAISEDGRDIYYSEIAGYYPIRGASIKRYTFSEGKWNGPFRLFEGLAPSLSVTGDTMFFERMDDKTNYLTFISVKGNIGWGEPKRILSRLNNAHYTQSTHFGNFYTSSKATNGAGLTDWCSIITEGYDTTASSLGRPLNTGGENLDFFIPRDESFMIVTNRPGLGISYRKDDGSWTNPRNFGPIIDFGLGSWGPWVTPDNKYLFYSTGTKPDYSDVYTYWVRIDGIIDSLRHTNLSPYITTLIENQVAFAGQPFRFTVPENIFTDEDSIDTLTYSAQMLNGDPIPAWIDFNPSTKTFSGVPEKAGEETVFVVVTDSDKAIAYCPVKITISDKPAK